ncbi:MAG: hypothetical protein WCK21_09975, partial [Actinomycetota bacterium]
RDNEVREVSRGRLAVVLAGTAVVCAACSTSIATPKFGSLAAQPDSALRGTVAFLKPYPDNGCVWVVAASGAKPKKVACVDGGAGDLKWRPDGRIQSTRYKGGEGTGDTRSWIFDVATGAVEDVPLDQIPPQKNPPSVVAGPRGEKVTSRSENGRLTTTMSDQTETRTLLAVDAPGTYTLGQPTWSSDGEWFIVKDDLDRLLLVTTADPSRTRVLVDGGYAPAVTADEVPSNSGG